MRFGFVARAYGWREGLRALPRTITANIIAMMAARRALAAISAVRGAGAAVGQDRPRLPAALPGRMSLPPPLRFLALVAGGWICVRAAILVPDWTGTRPRPPP